MREIKFRGRDDLTGNGWVYGDFSHGYYGNECLVDEILVVEKTVGQFTGLLDCEGREIYEGDVIRVCGCNGIVVYSEGSFIVHFEKAPSLLSHCIGGDFSNPERVTSCRVIGNVHDNPDLLEAKNARD